MNKQTAKIINDIKNLKIQGARNIAKSAVRAMLIESDSFKGNDRNAYFSRMLVTADALASARPTEPMLRNYLRFIILRIASREGAPVSEMKEELRTLTKTLFDKMKTLFSMLVDYGSALIGNGGVYYTHCHSSTVVSIFKQAYDDGRDFSVIVGETRPKYQGVKTAKELSSHGIPTTLVVDSAARLYIKKCDSVFVGSDAITASGNLINKIGTSSIAHFAYTYDVPFYSAAELYKFDSLTRWGIMELIEQRDPSEVLSGKKPPNLSIENPAFDLTLSRYITAYITEKGVIPPQSIVFLAR